MKNCYFSCYKTIGTNFVIYKITVREAIYREGDMLDPFNDSKYRLR